MRLKIIKDHKSKKLNLFSTFEVAINVLNAIKIPKDSDGEFLVEVWANGREQGFYVHNIYASRGVVFSRERSSDRIFVVYGTVGQFHPTTNQPEEGLYYKNYISFDPGKYDSAAEFVIRWLTKQFNGKE